MHNPSVTVVLVVYNMPREWPRTLLSLSPLMQRGIAADDYEIIVVDNGSWPPLNEAACRAISANARLCCIDPAPPSPVLAINTGLALAHGSLVGVMIDGARLASPGLVAQARNAARLHHRPIVATLGFHLGPAVQMQTVPEGYNDVEEDRLLAAADWESDGYRLFGISALAGSSREGWFGPMAESNALFLPRNLWTELGGYEVGFSSVGGGFANLDAYTRACELPDSQLLVLLGEGTFHQVHGGIATNRLNPPSSTWQQEYRALRGKDFVPPVREPSYFGRVSPHAIPWVERSARKIMTPLRVREAAPWFCALDGNALAGIQSGVMATRYRGRELLKSPFDLVLYLQLLQRLQPRTLIEVGIKEGGSILWFADTLRNLGIQSRVIGIDRASCPPITDPSVQVLQGDAMNLEAVLPAAQVSRLPHPFLVIEDSAHMEETSRAVLDFFDPHLQQGDYIIVEDGVVRFLPNPACRQYRDGPNRAVAGLLARASDRYAIDREMCDFFGVNVTYNPNAWLLRL